jgi:membrane-bound serine protease (ClpP class)
LAGLLALVCVAAPLLAQSTRPALGDVEPATRPVTHKVAVVPLRGDIDEYNEQSLKRRFQQAREAGADTVIVVINTYGGLVTAGLDISRFLKQQKDLHIIAYVEDKAISAGSMIAVACDEIVMEPHAQLGDCGVIVMGQGGGLESVGETERAKMESPVLADFRDSADRNGYPPALLQAMVRMKLAVHWIENAQTGQRQFVDGAAYTKLIAEGWKPVEGVPDPIDGDASILMLGTDLAVKIGLAKAQVSSVAEFAASRGYAVVATFEPSKGDQVVQFLSSMTVRGLLTTVFLLSLYISFSSPGHGAAEAVALISLCTLVGVPMLTGYASWLELLMVLVGIALLAVELFVIPGFGFVGISGIVLILAGLTLTFVPPIMPTQLPDVRFSWLPVQQGLIVTTSGLVGSLLLWAWLGRYVTKLPYLNRLVLQTPVGTAVEPTAVVPLGGWPVVGAIGEAATDLRPGGIGRFMDDQIGDTRTTDVVSDRGFVRAGVRVVVREVEGSRVVVRPV